MRARFITVLMVFTFLLIGCGGGHSSSSATGGPAPYSPPQLSVVAISPSRIQIGIPIIKIAVWGENFGVNSRVLFDGVFGNSMLISSNEVDLMFDTSVSLTAQAGMHTVQLQDPLRGTSPVFTLTVYQPAPGPQEFNAEPTTFIHGESVPRGDVLADFNGDGYADLVMASESTYSLYLFNGRADGTFSPPMKLPYTFGEDVGGIAAGDLNGDGYPDLVVVGLHSDGTEITTLLNDGKGNLQPYTTSTYPAQNFARVALGYFYGTGNLDLVVSSTSANGEMLLFAGQGDGNFANPVPLGLPNLTCLQITTADFNQDGLPDIVYEGANGGPIDQIRILTNLGNGKFSDSQPAALANLTGPFAVGDFNGDRKPDIAALTYYNPLIPITIVFGQGDGTFIFGNSISKAQIGQPVDLVAGDLDGDGNADLIVSTNINGPDQAGVFWGDGTGNFTLQMLTEETSTVPLIGDVNGDGIDDLVQPAFFYFVGVTLGRKDRTFALPEYVQPAFEGVTSAVDALGDGFQDLFVSGKVTDTGEFPGTVYHLQPDGSFKAIGNTPASGVTMADLNGDGIADLIAHYNGGTIAVWKGDGSGDFGSGTFGSTPPVYQYPLPGATYQVEVHDMDGDGIPDIVVSGMIFYGKGGIGFDPVPVQGTLNIPFLVGDFDGDGILDIATPNGIMFGLGNRKYTPLQGTVPAFASNSYGATWAIADLNGDGKDDIVFNEQNWIEIALSSGRQGIFVDQVLDTGDWVGFIGVADFNGDGRPDIVTGTYDAEDITLFTNDGKGGYLTSTCGIGAQTYGGVVADFYHHGKPDVAIIDVPLNYRPQSVVLVSHK